MKQIRRSSYSPDLFENVERVLSKKALSSPFNKNQTVDVLDSIVVTQVSFSYYNEELVLLLDYDEPDDVEVKYQNKTTTTLTIDSSSLDVFFSPSIFVDTPYRVVSNYFLDKISHDFSIAITTWGYHVDGGIGAEKVKDAVNKKIKALILSIRKGTALNSTNFRPFNDLDVLFVTISKGIENFLKTDDPIGTPEDEKNKAPEVDLSKFYSLSAKTIFEFKEDYINNIGDSSRNYIQIHRRQAIKVTLQINGSLQSLTDFYNKVSGVSIQMDRLAISLPPLKIFYDNELVLTIDKMTIFNGGAVSVDSFELHGLAKSLEATEILIKAVLQIIVIGHGVRQNPIVGLGVQSIVNSNSTKAKEINNFIRQSLEEAMQNSISDLVESSKNLIPGFNLKSFLGK
jgi:hypothetical protein